MAIEKGKSAKKALDFSSLKEEGIEWIERLAGKRWTDYNQHDPGITILEQLIYALTELAYRANYPIEDLLAQAPGSKQKKTNLFEAWQVMPAAPSSLEDFRKLVIDTKGVQNAWVEALPMARLYRQPIRGLYRVDVIPKEETSGQFPPKGWPNLHEEILNKLMRNRNLCEDFVEIRCMKPRPIAFHNTEFILAPGADQDEVLAEIYYQLDTYLRQAYKEHSLFELQAQGLSPSEIFDGPPVRYGFVRSQDLNPKMRAVQYSKILEFISSVAGVQSVYRMELESPDARRERYEIYLEEDEYPILQIQAEAPDPDSRDQHPGIILFKSGQAVQTNMSEVRRLFFLKKALKERAYDLEVHQHVESRQEEGQYRKLGKYYSIQHQFPQAYGLLQDSQQTGSHMIQGFQERMSGRERMALIRQLKGYLALFEQFLANYLAQLEQTRDLLSAGNLLDHSYFVQSLAESVPYIKPLLVDQNDLRISGHDIFHHHEGDSYEEALHHIGHHHDPWAQRRHAFLDHLLARYGEVFPKVDGKRFNYYLSENEYQLSVLRAKSRFLSDYVSISRDRSKGLNYREPSWNADSLTGLEQRIQLYLSLTDGDLQYSRLRKSLAGAIAGLNINFEQQEDDSEDCKPTQFIEFESDQIDESFHYLIEAEEELEEAKDAIEDITDDEEKCLRRLQSHERDHDNTLQKIVDKQKEIAAQDKHIRDLEKAREDAAKDMRREEREFNRCEKELQALNRELEKSNDRLEKLTQQKTDKSHHHTATTHRHQEALEYAEEAEQMLEDAQEELEDWQQRLQELHDEESRTEEQIDACTIRIEKLRQEKADKEAIASAKKELKELKKQKKRTESQISQNNSKAEQARQKMAKAEKRLSTSTDMLRNAASKLKTTDEDYKEVKKQMEAVIAENESLQKELPSLLKGLNTNRKELQAAEKAELEAQEALHEAEAKRRLFVREVEIYLGHSAYTRKRIDEDEEALKVIRKDKESLLERLKGDGLWPQEEHDLHHDRLFDSELIDASLLHYGFRKNNFMIGRGEASKTFKKDPGHYVTVFYDVNRERWRLLAEHPSKSRAVSFLRWLIGYIRRLNMESEGFHIVEHLLLRPLNEQGQITYSYEHQNKVALLLYDPNGHLLLRSYDRYEGDRAIKRAQDEITYCGAGVIFHHLEQDKQGRYYLELHDRNDRILAVAPHRFETFRQALHFSKYLFDTCLAYERIGRASHSNFRHDTLDTFISHDLPDQFFSFSVSVVYPTWPARFRNQEFIDILRNTIRREVPAHIHIHFLPMDVTPLKCFEDAYSEWLNARAKETPGLNQINKKAKKLAALLAKHIRKNEAKEQR